MCSIDALSLAPYLVPVFAGALLVSTSLMCFMRRSYEATLSKVAGRVTLLESQAAASYYPPAPYAMRPTAPPPLPF